MGDIPLIDALYDIRNGKYATEINRIRAFMDAGNQDEADMQKKKLPAITVSATYQKQRLPKYMTGYNPLTILDFDELNKEDLPRLLALVREAVYTVACWISPRGRGIKIIVYPAVGTELIPANHLAVYKLVKDWYEHLLGVGADTSGSDAGRLCIMSYDQQLYLSPRFEPWLKGEGFLPATATASGLPERRSKPMPQNHLTTCRSRNACRQSTALMRIPNNMLRRSRRPVCSAETVLLIRYRSF